MAAKAKANKPNIPSAAPIELPAPGAPEILELPLVPLRELVVFPEMILPLVIGRSSSVEAFKVAAGSSNRLLALVTQRDPATEAIAGVAELYDVGAMVQVIQFQDEGDGSIRAIIAGKKRIQILALVATEPYLIVRAQIVEPVAIESVEVEALVRTVQGQFEDYVRAGASVPPEAAVAARNISDPSQLADMIAYSPDFSLAARQEVLAELDVTERLRKVSAMLARELEVVNLKGKIQSDVKSSIDKSQREFILREQMAAIARELGEDNPMTSEVGELRAKIEAAGMPEEVKAKALHDLERLRRIPQMSPELGVVRNYLDWLIALPWAISTDEHIDLGEATKILDEDHYGLETVKERILEFLAVRTLAANLRSPILVFVGPPGVGKTSLGKSIARAMGRKFVRMSLGGLHDEAEIRGHRSTYIGALPGRIIQGMKNAGSNNPIFMLDEIDKLGRDFRGDPSSALLEVLDPEQNNTFTDNYLEVPFDLSKVLFIATGNLLDPIPPALRDRMEIITMAGYTEQEKLQIAKRFLVPKQLAAHGLDAARMEIGDEALIELIRSYTREAGVRQLEREIAGLCRKVARKIASGDETKVAITVADLDPMLGPAKFAYGELELEDQVGAATGLVVTEVGGDVVTVEVTVMEGREDFILTGQLGEVMRESARAGLSWIRSNADRLGIPKTFFEHHTLHIHVPAGAIPKDGPSAGVTMVSAMVSAITAMPLRRDVAMTGEITLRGRVLPIGGLKSKILAAHLAGATIVIMPKQNEKDLRDVPDVVKANIKLVSAATMDDVLKVAVIGWPPKPLEPAAPVAPLPTLLPEAGNATSGPLN